MWRYAAIVLRTIRCKKRGEGDGRRGSRLIRLFTPNERGPFYSAGTNPKTPEPHWLTIHWNSKISSLDERARIDSRTALPSNVVKVKKHQNKDIFHILADYTSDDSELATTTCRSAAATPAHASASSFFSWNPASVLGVSFSLDGISVPNALRDRLRPSGARNAPGGILAARILAILVLIPV